MLGPVYRTTEAEVGQVKLIASVELTLGLGAQARARTRVLVGDVLLPSFLLTAGACTGFAGPLAATEAYVFSCLGRLYRGCRQSLNLCPAT